MADLVARLSEAQPRRRIGRKAIRDGVLAVTGGGDVVSFHSRTLPVAGGTAGFTLAWNTDLCSNGHRVAVLMANGLTAFCGELLPAPPPRVAPLKPAVFRTTPLQVGEGVSILGFPTADALDHCGSLLPQEREKVARRSRDG